MFDLKKHIIKHFSKIKVVHSIPGRIRVKLSNTSSIPVECSTYDDYLKLAVTMLDGIEEINFNYLIGTLLIKYDIDRLYEEKIITWLNKIIEIGINNLDIIEKYGQNNLDYVIKTLEQQLKDSINSI